MNTVKVLLAIGLLVLSSAFAWCQDEWIVPDKFKKMENLIEFGDEERDIAKELYSRHCQICHGKTGLGDGSKSEKLDTPSVDFTQKGFQNQADGVLFYKITFGKGDMPAFDKKIKNEEDRWLLIHHLRTLKK